MKKQAEILKSILMIAVLKGTAILMAFLMFSYGKVTESKFLEKKAAEEVEKEIGEKELRQAFKLFETEGDDPNLKDSFTQFLFFQSPKIFTLSAFLNTSKASKVSKNTFSEQLHTPPFYILYHSLLV
ncbi:MAG: hypothetical protein OHK0038_06880 [Flammeovirgaceae bacterium]